MQQQYQQIVTKIEQKGAHWYKNNIKISFLTNKNVEQYYLLEDPQSCLDAIAPLEYYAQLLAQQGPTHSVIILLWNRSLQASS